MKIRKVIVLMTALLPTTGHRDLINYALSLGDTLTMDSRFDTYIVEVIVSSRTFEPIKGIDRFDAILDVFQDKFYKSYLDVHLHEDDTAPQNPNGDNDVKFWNYWKKIIEDCVGEVNEDDVVVSSETYGNKLAEVLGCTHYLYDIKREMNNIKGSDVREDIEYNFVNILPYMRELLMIKATIFGAESCGKTTTTDRLARYLDASYIAEWARGYLENETDKTITSENMRKVINGQYTLQKHAYRNVNNTSILLQDTDLLSTLGYYRIKGLPIPEDLYKKIEETKSDIYFVMGSNIPFESDELRYGGDKRESTDQFWIDLLVEFDCKYVYVNEESLMLRVYHMTEVLLGISNERFGKIRKFERE